jgi:hypothetical protein
VAKAKLTRAQGDAARRLALLSRKLLRLQTELGEVRHIVSESGLEFGRYPLQRLHEVVIASSSQLAAAAHDARRYGTMAERDAHDRTTAAYERRRAQGLSATDARALTKK